MLLALKIKRLVEYLLQQTLLYTPSPSGTPMGIPGVSMMIDHGRSPPKVQLFTPLFKPPYVLPQIFKYTVQDQQTRMHCLAYHNF